MANKTPEYKECLKRMIALLRQGLTEITRLIEILESMSKRPGTGSSTKHYAVRKVVRPSRKKPRRRKKNNE